MIPANKKILTIILVSIWLTGQYLLTRFFVYNDTNNHFTFEGLLAGIILIAIYQQNLLNEWVYHHRYLLNSIALGVGLVIIGLLDYVVMNIDGNLGLRLASSFGTGFSLGLVLLLINHLTVRKWNRKNPVPEPMLHSLSCKAVEVKNDRAINTGLVILQEDRLLFHPVKCSNREILFTEIAQIRIGHLIGFPQHLILYLNGGQSVTYNLSMPHFWMKRINSLKNREISQVTVNTL